MPQNATWASSKSVTSPRYFFLNLPLTNPQRVLFIHTNSHTKWLYGSELQIPTLKDFHDLRRATSRCFRKDMRCLSFCYFLRPSKIPSRNQWQRGPRTCFLSYAFFTKQNQTKCTASWLNLPGQRHTIPEHTRTKHGLVHSVATMMREMCWDIDPDNPCTFITPCEPLVTFNQIQNDETKEDFVLSRGEPC